MKNSPDNPILYRKVVVEDFPDTYHVEKATIEAGPDGYIKDNLLEAVDIEENTTVVNIGTGQGKSTAIIELIGQYYGSYVIIVASPTKALVKKYYSQIKSHPNVNEEDVVLYQELEAFPVDAAGLASKGIHIITINSLLGNPGEEFFKQNETKRQYLEAIRRRCREQGLKAILVFDEIHEGVHNFQAKFYPNLLKWRDVTHKTFILSATFSESAIVVIRQIAALTENKIKVIESPRIKLPVTQADLVLFFVKENYSWQNVFPLEKPIVSIVQEAQSQNKNLNVLVYSKKLAHEFVKGDNRIKEALHGLEQGVTLITSDTDEEFDQSSNRCHVGTTFKSGVDITDPNSVFIIVAPPRNAIEGLVRPSSAGIFANGAPEITQSLARIRNGGKIIIFLSEPPCLIRGEYLDGYFQHYPFNTPQDEESFVPYENHSGLISAFYQAERAFYQPDIAFLDQKRDAKEVPELHFPSLDEFILRDGHRFLSSRYLSCGFRTSPYIVWAALKDQFPNCKLKKIEYFPSKVRLRKEHLVSDIRDYILEHYRRDREGGSEIADIIYQTSDGKGYDGLLGVLFGGTIVEVTEGDRQMRTPVNELKKALLSILYGLKFAGDVQEFTLQDHLLHNIQIVRHIRDTQPEIPENERDLVDAYLQLGELREEFLQLVGDRDRMFGTLESDPSLVLPDEFAQKAIEAASVLNNRDKLISENTFSFLQNLQGAPDAKNSIYRAFTRVFLSLDPSEKRDSTTRARIWQITGRPELPEVYDVLNLNFTCFERPDRSRMRFGYSDFIL